MEYNSDLIEREQNKVPENILDKIKPMKMKKSSKECTVCMVEFHEGNHSSTIYDLTHNFRLDHQKATLQAHIPQWLHHTLVFEEL